MRRVVLGFMIMASFSSISAAPVIENRDGKIYFTRECPKEPRNQAKRDIKPKKIRVLVTPRVGYFQFQEKKLKKIYKKGGIHLDLSATARLWDFVFLDASLGYYEKKGSSLGKHEHITKLKAFPVSIGLKPMIRLFPKLHGYICGGPRYFFVSQYNHSKYVTQHVHANGLGFYVAPGLILTLNDRLKLEGFIDYSYFRRTFESHPYNVYGHTLNVGGLAFGGGIGYSF
jgi:hypothetical protein